MVYTTEEKKKIDNLLEVFAEYTAQHPDFDIAYSDKTGYVRLIVAECSDWAFFPMKTFDDLVEMFAMEIVYEEVHKDLEKYPNMMNYNVDYDKIRCRMRSYIVQLEDQYQEQAEKAAERYIRQREMSIYLP